MSEEPPVLDYGRPQPPLPRNMAVASMVLGIVSLLMPIVCLMCCFPGMIVALTAAGMGLVLGIIARNRAIAGLADGQGMATAGIICSILALIQMVLLFVALLYFADITVSPWPPVPSGAT